MGDKSEILIGLIQNLSKETNARFDELKDRIYETKMSVQKVDFTVTEQGKVIDKIELIHKDMVEAIDFYKSNKENLQTAAMFLKRPKMATFLIAGVAVFLIISIIGLGIRYNIIRIKTINDSEQKPKIAAVS